MSKNCFSTVMLEKLMKFDKTLFFGQNIKKDIDCTHEYTIKKWMRTEYNDKVEVCWNFENGDFVIET